MKDLILLLASVIGAALSHFFGTWDAMVEAMIVFMVIDIVSGTMVAAWFKKSRKSRDGRLWSVAMWRGMAKKGMALFFVIVGAQFDLLLDRDYIRSAVIFCVLTSELLSIIENAALMGVPVPGVIKKMLTVVSDKVTDKVTDKAANDITEEIVNGRSRKKDGGES